MKVFFLSGRKDSMDRIDIEYSDRTENDKMLIRLMAYQRFLQAIQDKGVTPYNVSKNTKIATSTLSDWKNGKSMPKYDKMVDIANYLEVDPEYLVSGCEKSDIQIAAETDEEILSDKKLVKALKMYLAQDEKTKDKIVRMIELMCE